MKIEEAAWTCAAILCAAAPTFAGVLHVSPDGLSPHGALEKIRAAKAKGDKSAWTVSVEPGFYVLEKPLVFLPCDSGAPDAPVAWIGMGKATRFSGGVRVTGWKDAGGGVWAARIPAAPDGKPAYFEQLWVNGRRADRARFPDRPADGGIAGCMKISSFASSAVTNAAGGIEYVERTTPQNAAALASVPADELPHAQMCVVHKWSFTRRIVRSVDRETLSVETRSPVPVPSWGIWSPEDTVVWFENVRSAFDAPGEWFLDVKAGLVLYRPLPDEDMASAEVVAPSSGLSRIVEFRGDPEHGRFVHDIVFKDVSFVHSAPRPGNAGPSESWQHQAASSSDGMVVAEGARRIVFDSCGFAHSGNYALRFDDGCQSNRIENCLMEDLGAGGVWIGARRGYVAPGETLSRGPVATVVDRSTAFNTVSNCAIRGGGRFNPEGTAVAITHASDTKVVNCDICDFYYTGVSVGFTWGFGGSVAQRNEIAFNRIWDLGKGVMSDMGGVYTLGTSFGTRVHHNVIHDVKSYSYGGWALYTDEGSEGVTMECNLCWNTTDGGFHQHFGTGCRIRNNIFAWNVKGGAVSAGRDVMSGVPCTLDFENNIVAGDGGIFVVEGASRVGGVWRNNLWYAYSGEAVFEGKRWEEWRAGGKESGGKYADPLFEDAAKHDFRLKPDSPALSMGFEPWDCSLSGRRN